MSTEQKELKLGRQVRAQSVESSGLDTEARTLSLSFSSELPYERWWGTEILSHENGAMDMSRLNDGAPLLFNHDPDQVIGVVVSASVQDNRGVATVRFSKSPLGEQMMQDVADGILRNVSVGYQINKVLEDMNEDTYTAVDWTPLEISLVAVPADPTVGVGRAAADDERSVIVVRSINETAQAETERGNVMPENTNTAPADNAVAIENARREGADEARKTVQEIYALGERLGKQDLARQLVEGGKTLDEARSAFLEAVGARQQPVAAPAGDVDLNDQEQRNYSLIRAINATLTGNWKQAGLERAASEAIAKRVGRETAGFFMPANLEMRASYAVGTAGAGTTGGTLVANNLLSGSFIDLLRNKALVASLGATFLTGLVGNVTIPRQSAAGNTYWVGENGNITESEGAFDSIELSPKTIANISQISRLMLMQSTPDIEMLVRNDLLATMALGIDLAAITGSGASGQPLGILNTAGIGSVAMGTNGGNMTIDALVQMEEAVAIANADIGSLAYLTNPKVIAALKLLKSTTGQYLWSNSPIGQRSGTPGEINGYPVARTNQIPSNLTKGTGTNLSAAIFGNWSDLIIGEWGTIEILANPYASTAFNQGAVQLRAMQSVDINVRHAASFAAATDIIAS